MCFCCKGYGQSRIRRRRECSLWRVFSPNGPWRGWVETTTKRPDRLGREAPWGMRSGQWRLGRLAMASWASTTVTCWASATGAQSNVATQGIILLVDPGLVEMMERSSAEETVSGRIRDTLRYARRRLGLDEVLRFAARCHTGVIDARWSPTDAYRRSRSAGAASSASSAFWGQGA